MDILHEPRASFAQIQAWVASKKTAHPLAMAMLPILWESALANGIDPCVLIAQSMKETGWFNFKGVIRPNFCNTCGLKVTKGGGDQDPGAHKRFEYWEDGIMAHSDHLALYAGAPNMPKYSPECASHPNEGYKGNGTTQDPRHFTYLLGKCKTVESLGGNWAPSSTYGTDIVKMINEIIATPEPITRDSLLRQIDEMNTKLDEYGEAIEDAKETIEHYKGRNTQLELTLQDMNDRAIDAERKLGVLQAKVNAFKQAYNDLME